MALSFAFGGSEGTTYDDLKRRQSIAQALWARGGQGTPKTAMEGLNSAAQSITGALLAKKLGRQIKGEQDKFGLLFNGALGGFGGQPMGGAGTATPYVAEDQYKREAFPLGQTGPAPERNTETVGGKAYDMGTPVQDPTLGLIKEFEGFRETPYWDVNAHRVGFGSDTITLPDGTVQRVAPGVSVSEADAERDLQRRVNTEFVPIVRRAIGDEAFASLNPNQRAALTSIAYNYGKLPGSVADAVRSGNVQSVTSAIQGLGSHNNGINAKRRAREAATFAGSAISAPQSGGVTTPMLLSMASDPRASDAQRGVLQMLLQQQMQANDPLRQMQIQKMQAEIDGIGKMTPYQQASLDMQGQRLAQAQQSAAADAPSVQKLKLDDGSEVAVQWDAGKRQWVPINAPEGGGLAAPKNKLTESQSKLTLFQSLQTETNPVLADLEDQWNPANFADRAAMTVPIAGNYWRSPEAQMYQSAASAWAEGALRIATGAAATPEEMERTMATYFARPGDTPQTVQFKAQMRASYDRAIQRALGEKDVPGEIPLPSEFAAKANEPTPETAAQPEQQGNAADFSKMTIADIGQVDIGSLNDAQMDALEARMKELGL